ncbi:hypothetical protein ACF1G5_42490 [Streptomyces coeruleorubidus]|uniref:hypothetical protein n=1 Tax=Streptomyces coeruleorubidus TaxID=116188 RepID=UPI0036FAED0C
MSTPTPPQPNFPPPLPPEPPKPAKSRTNLVIMGSAAAAIAAIVITGVAVANSDGSDEADATPAPTITVTETAEMTDQEILDKSMEILESAEADVDAGIEPDVTIPAVEETEEEPEGPLTSIDEGTYLVGEDVKAGSYKTSGPSDGMCYWARNKDDSGELKAIIANDILKGPGRVTLNKGEIFETNGCDTWQLAE